MDQAHLYQRQERGGAGAYDRYLAGMDASMRQKVALTAAHVLCRGRIADMGMGSGGGSAALAALYPGLEVVGVDVNPTMVERARERHRHCNLEFVAGDIAASVFPPSTLDAILDSSVLHHVTSFQAYDHGAAVRALAVQVEQLRPHGVLVVRDFVDPGGGEILLDLPDDDGDASEDPRSCSTAALLVRFSREFRALSDARGFPCEEAAGAARGWRRFRLAHKHAAEFLLRKDYRDDWESEVLEEYTYLTQPGFEAAFAGLGLRTLASTPLRNPWIVRRRWQGRVLLRDLEERALELPPTNYVIAGEKVPAGEGVRLREAGAAPPLGFLKLEHHRRRRDGVVFDVVRRPHTTLDVLPHFESAGELLVLARASYPRPILSAAPDALDGSRPPCYVSEPLNVLMTDKPAGQTVEEALEVCARIPPSRVLAYRAGAAYYPSPGGIQEEVRSLLVEIEPVFVEDDIAGHSGFRTSGRVRAIEAQQLLRAAQVGALPDARLELNVHELLLREGRDAGPWIGEEMAPREAEAPVPTPTKLCELLARPPRRAFERAAAGESRGFLELRCSRFDELASDGTTVASNALEWVVPRLLSERTVVTALLLRSGGDVLLGIDDDDLPAAQSFEGSSALLVAPAWRLPREVRGSTGARAWIVERLASEYGLACGEIWELGGRYYPSPGITPEVVQPLAIEVRSIEARESLRPLAWVRLRELVDGRSALRDGHLLIAALRAAHAAGLLKR